MTKKAGLGKWFGEEWVDVKTGKPCGRKSAKGKPKRPYTKEDCDIIAMVGLLDNTISFRAVEELHQITKKIHRRDFDSNDLTERTWNKALALSLQSTKELLKGI